MYSFFLKFYIVSDSNFSHKKIPSIVNRLVFFLFPVYYKGIISMSYLPSFYLTNLPSMGNR
ncbi:hypothetical protein BW893_26185 [Bacillus wiedmannii]|nr:hypothetical protein BW893_26185 [Bacillus wiedmannii]